MKLSHAAALVHGTYQGEDVDFSGISIDTRTLNPGELYIAIKGEQFDGHDFIEQAFSQGAAAVLVSQTIETDQPVIKVTDTRQAFGALAHDHRRQNRQVKGIGITGSCGKTTTRVLMESVFSQAGETLASQGSFNNDLGVPITLLQLKPEYQYYIQEIGMNHPGEIAPLAKMAEPDIAVITNIAMQHIEAFDSQDGIAQEKAHIYEALPDAGIAVINLDCPYAKKWQQQFSDKQHITFAIQHDADVMASDVQLNSTMQARFNLHYAGQSQPVQLKLLGEHNVMNALAAAACAFAAGLSLEQVCVGLEQASAEKGRLKLKQGLHGAKILDDSYNASLTAVCAALHILTDMPGKSIFVFGDMKELGEHVQSAHEKVGQLAKELGVSALYCYGESVKYTAKQFGEHAHYFEDQADLIRSLETQLDNQAIVLVKGAGSMKMNKIVQAITEE